MQLAVSSVMTKPAVTVRPETSSHDCMHTMRLKRITGMPVVDGNGRLIGMVTQGDLSNGAPTVDGAMSRDVFSLGPDVSIAEAARAMYMRDLKRIPVVDGDRRVIGIITRDDLLTIIPRTERRVLAEVRRVVANLEAAYNGRDVKAHLTKGVVELSGWFRHKSRCDTCVRTVTMVEGVIGVRSLMTYDIDDT